MFASIAPGHCPVILTRFPFLWSLSGFRLENILFEYQSFNKCFEKDNSKIWNSELLGLKELK